MVRILVVDPLSLDLESIACAAREILHGRLVAFPTETVYGLGANALDSQAVEHIFAVKERPPTDPLIVHIASADDLPRVARDIPQIAHRLADAFWPGPLTLVLPKHGAVPDNVTAGLGTVAVRVPSHPVTLALLRACGVPIAAPSANRFGSVSPTTAQHVLADLGDRIDLILDGGPTLIGVESTVLDITNARAKILRPGGITREALEAIIGSLDVYAEPAGKSESITVPQPSPGLMAKHYAPRAELLLVIIPDLELALAKIAGLARQKLAEGRRVGLLLAEEDEPFFSGLPVKIFPLGTSEDLDMVARNLYAGLRTLDEQGVEVIVARDYGEQGLGLAIRDRLRRAASHIITK
jgi:L-threonylcarbamoyladenylate synthase